jgi:hypothetical protein
MRARTSVPRAFSMSASPLSVVYPKNTPRFAVQIITARSVFVVVLVAMVIIPFSLLSVFE